ncbi:hypothetical protein PoB_007299400 [Plakobranchus ocellatus]|uniref:DUF7041 domain-containing protein n=1 Tax=Plakobranchus ocellatus TaxID=259542 RepID=A0AAV4DQK5_9GAST|nr:hypothetical protein PoB_007299400 [Plakobranchus ocellatus]
MHDHTRTRSVGTGTTCCPNQPVTINGAAARRPHQRCFHQTTRILDQFPEVWFARVEAQFGTKNMTHDQTRCDYVISTFDPQGVAAAGTPHQPNMLSVMDRTSGLSYLVDTGAEVSVYPASVQDRRAQQPTTTLTVANGTSIYTWGRRSVSLAIGHRGQYNHKFYVAD